MLIAFWQGTPAYNFANFAVSAVGLLLTIGAVIASRRAASAAESAEAATRRLRQQFYSLAASVEITELRGLLREGVARIEANSFDAGLLCLSLLRDRLARVRQLPGGSKVATPAEWRVVENMVRDLSDALRQRTSSTPPPAPEQLARVISELLEVGARLSRMQASGEVDTLGENP